MAKDSSKEIPDFAYPAKLAKAADIALHAALKNKDYEGALKNALNLCVASSLRTQESVQKNIELFDSLTHVMPQPWASLALLIEADLYKQVYEKNSWSYDRRELPLDQQWPAEITAWNKAMFATKTLDLVEGAADAINKNASDFSDGLKSLKNILTIDKGMDLWLPYFSIADFIQLKGADILSRFESFDNSAIIPFFPERRKSETIGERCYREAIRLCRNMIERNSAADNSIAESIGLLTMFRMRSSNHDENKDALLSKISDKEGYAIILQLLGRNSSDAEWEKKVYEKCQEWQQKFPDSPLSFLVKEKIATLTQGNVAIRLSEVAVPGKPIIGNATLSNVNKAYLLIYPLKEIIEKGKVDISPDFTKGPLHCIHLTAENQIPFSSGIEFSIPPLPPGKYVGIGSKTEKISKEEEKNRFRDEAYFAVSEISLLSFKDPENPNTSITYVVDSRNQKPVEGAKVILYKSRYSSEVIDSGMSDNYGLVRLKAPGGYVMAQKGESTAQMDLWSYSSRDFHKKICYHILTDQSLYRVGDKVRFSVIAWKKAKDSACLAQEQPLTVSMVDPNGYTKTTVELTTDSSGRAFGEFTIPSDGLLGSYRLQARNDKNTENTDQEEDLDWEYQQGNCYIEVAEYKLPRFFVTLEKVESKDNLPLDSIQFKGEVKTYSGMPVSGAKVLYTVNYRMWWRYGPVGTFSDSLQADGNGQFLISLPVAPLKGTPYETGNFMLVAQATAADGETEMSVPANFSIGEAFRVNTSIPRKIRVEGKEVEFKVNVENIASRPVKKFVDYRIFNLADNKKILEGRFETPTLKIESAHLPSGQYRLEFNLPDDSTMTYAETVIYRSNDKRAPYATPLWLPEQEIIIEGEESTVKVPVGSAYADSWIFYMVNSSKEGIKEGWLKVDGKNSHIEVAAPLGNNKTEISFVGMKDLTSRTETVTIVNAYSKRKLEIASSVMRDRMTAGNREKWQFRFKVADNDPGTVYAMAVMTDKALTAIRPFRWYFSPSIQPYFKNWGINTYQTGNEWINLHYPIETKDSKPFKTALPSWQTYGYSLIGERMYRPQLLYKMSSRASALDSAGAMEDGYDDLASVSESISSVPQAAPKMMNDTGVVELAEEAAGADEPDSNVELRPVELPIAFFMPDLTSDEEGNVTVEFEVPNFNTTWQFQLLSYNSELLTSVIDFDAVASKPVMVQANMPLFLRTSDKTTLRAILFNNSEIEKPVGGRIRVLEPGSGQILLEKEFDPEMLNPLKSRVVEIDFDVPTDCSQLEIHAIAYADKFSDGEKTVVPVYPSSSPVTEAVQFYMGAGARETVLAIPELREDANVTLKYCGDPIRECVLAMPAIATSDSHTSLVISKALYANCMAAKISQEFPQIKRGLERLFQSDGYKQLESALEADSSLKIVGLHQTPWVNNARNERERMLKLGELLDTAKVGRAIESLSENLKRLQNSDGGWSWCEGMKSSLFITTEVLLELGELNRAGALPPDVLDMVNLAFAYCDSVILKDYNKYKHISATGMLEYLYTKSFFSGLTSESKQFKALRKKALTLIRKSWKQFSIREKSQAAILLYRIGKKSVARSILRSLEEFAMKDVAKGWWYDNLRSGSGGWNRLLTTSMALNAYAEISPDSEAVDGLRQWLLLQKETEDWGSRDLTTQVIQSILASGTKWGEEATMPGIAIDGTALAIDGEQLEGMLTISLSPAEVSGKSLHIVKESASPAWGGVISQYIAPMEEVVKTDCENLSIEKRLLRLTTGPDGTVASEGDLVVGDKVRITLTVICDKDMDYVTIVDERGACLQPDQWLSGYTLLGDAWGYRETRDNRTTFFIEFLPKGTHVITYDCHVDRSGDYSTGIASIQSLYAPQNVAHSAGQSITVQ